MLYILICSIFNYRPAKKSKKDIFSILQSEEQATTNSTPRPASSFITRVSSGHVRRATNTTGDYFVELKVYKTEDINSVPQDERYRKALASLKLECADNSKEWDALQKFISTAYLLFENSEPVFFNYKLIKKD